MAQAKIIKVSDIDELESCKERFKGYIKIYRTDYWYSSKESHERS